MLDKGVGEGGTGKLIIMRMEDLQQSRQPGEIGEDQMNMSIREHGGGWLKFLRTIPSCGVAHVLEYLQRSWPPDVRLQLRDNVPF